jgi:MFS family permease
MNSPVEKPTNVRYGVLGFACALATITYLDRVCFGTVMPYIQAEFGLSEGQKGALFTAFAFAYALFEVPTGWLGDRYGARSTLVRVVLWWSVFTMLTGSIFPTTPAWIAFALLFTVRFLFGMGEAGAYPNIARAFHNWFPFTERGFAKGTVWMASRFAGGMTPLIVYALMFETTYAPSTPECDQRDQRILLGAVATAAGDPWTALVATGATLAEHRVTHWRHTFYIFGALGLVWCVLWWWWYRDDPAAKKGVNESELNLIREGVRKHEKKLVVPWWKLVTSINLWLLCIMYFFGAFGWYFNITYLPGYLKDQLGIEKGPDRWTGEFWRASLMAGLPLLVGSVSCLLGGVATDFFIRKTGNLKWGRRLFGVVGHGLCATCYFIAIFYWKSPWTFVILLAVAAFWNDLTMGAAWASCLDIGRRYSGIVAGCMNSIGNMGGALAGQLTGLIIEWNRAGMAKGTDEYQIATDRGWTINIALWGLGYLVAVVCWLLFDATKPIEAEAGDEH